MYKHILNIFFIVGLLFSNQLKKVEIKGNLVTKDYIILREIKQPIPGNYNYKIAKNSFSIVGIKTFFQIKKETKGGGKLWSLHKSIKYKVIASAQVK